jgi:hypothetical protein
MMDEQTIVYLAFSMIAALFILVGMSNFGPLSILVALLAVITIMMIMLLNFADFLIFPVITKTLGITVTLAKGYVAPKEQNRVVKYKNGLYYATGYLTANLYKYVFREENIAGEEEQQMSAAPDKWERIVMNIDFPFKYSIVSNPKDIQKYREDLEGDRGYLEFQISKMSEGSSQNSMAIEEANRKMNILQARIDRISGGELPINGLMYIETVAVGVSDKAAADALTAQLSRLETVFNAFDLNISRVVGRELHTLYNMNYRLYDEKDLEKLFQTQK